MADNRNVEDGARRHRARKADRRELLSMAALVTDNEHAMRYPDLRCEVAIEGRIAFLSQARCTRLHGGSGELRHARSRG